MRRYGLAAALLVAAGLARATPPALPGPGGLVVGVEVRERLARDGRVRVLVDRGPDAEGRPGLLEEERTFGEGRYRAGWLTLRGLATLERDGTRTVVLDRLVRPAGQVGTAQIGADRLSSAGLNGEGRSIAIVDTGVDLFHPDLGASAEGPGRVIGGWNFADGNSDVYDCDGHGTASAGVAAGAQGVAPKASIVALKVFGARDGCMSAWTSDVLAAVDWALDHREELRIDVLNVSLADERRRPGFCDGEDPVSATVFARARAAGLPVVAASGNDGDPNGLSWPACHADVVSVGMVYSAGIGPTSWNGASSCTDAVTGPDIVPCASNGGPTLSMLAPGVRWLVPTAGGGRRTVFSGTSAAAPAAAASLLLARQFAPLSDPALAGDFLRLTGVPVADERTGEATPRIDIGSAFAATSPFTGPCERVEAPVPAASALVCRAETSSLVGDVSSLAVALSVESPRLAALRVYLAGPDGANVLLVDGLSRPGRVFREVIGRTVDSHEPLSLFRGRPSAGSWTLRIEDDAGLAGVRLTSWALEVEPEAPKRSGRGRATTQLLPTVTRNAGLFGAFFSTDVVLFNPDPTEPAEVQLSFLPAGTAPERAPAVELVVPPLGTRILSDAVGNAFRTTGFGPVHVSAPTGVVVASRTDTTAPGGGTYGLLARGVEPERGLRAGEPPAWLAPVSRPGRSRVNLGLVEVDGAPASVEVLVRDAGGFVKGTLSLDLEPLGSRQVNDIHAAVGAGAGAGDLFELRVLSGAGRVVGWATSVDNGSNDGLLVVSSGTRRDAYLPAAARSPGRYGSFFRTDLKVSNPWTSPVNVRITFHPTKGADPAQLVLSLGAWETRVFEDVLWSLLGISSDAAGAFRLTVLGDAPGIVASSRTYTEEPGKTYGLAIGLLENTEAVAGERIALTFLSSSSDTRTNLGFLETYGIETSVEVLLYDAAGTEVARRELRLGPNQAVQWNDVFAEMGTTPLDTASAIVEVLRGGAVIAHAIRVDNRTNDGSFLPGRLLRPPLDSRPSAR